MPHVLIVDDELGIRTLLSEILEDEGYAVSTAQDAKHARACVKEDKFDLILLDIWMPDTDGVTLLKEWVATGAINCPVIMMSGHGTIETAMEATRFGAMDFLEKPIAMKRLLQTCERVLQDWKVMGKQSFEALVSGKTSELKGVMHLHHPIPCEGCYLLEKGIPSVEQANGFQVGKLPVIEVAPLGIVLDFNRSFRDMREDFERAYLTRVLHLHDGSVAGLAAHSQLERTHLYRKLKALGLDTLELTKQDTSDKRLPVFGRPNGSTKPFDTP